MQDAAPGCCRIPRGLQGVGLERRRGDDHRRRRRHRHVADDATGVGGRREQRYGRCDRVNTWSAHISTTLLEGV